MLGLGRKKDEAAQTPATSQPTSTSAEPQANGSHVARPGAKNRPTPKRRDQEAARRHLVVDPDRKGAAARDRAHSREDARTRQQAMLAGEEWALPDRDRGAFRRYARDYVDARFNVGELLMPLVFVSLVLSWLFAATKIDALSIGVFVITYGIFAAAIVDAALAYRRLKKRFLEAHPGVPVPAGSGFYAGMRMMQIRRWRAPRPQVERGQFPR